MSAYSTIIVEFNDGTKETVTCASSVRVNDGVLYVYDKPADLSRAFPLTSIKKWTSAS